MKFFNDMKSLFTTTTSGSLQDVVEKMEEQAASFEAEMVAKAEAARTAEVDAMVERALEREAEMLRAKREAEMLAEAKAETERFMNMSFMEQMEARLNMSSDEHYAKMEERFQQHLDAVSSF